MSTPAPGRLPRIAPDGVVLGAASGLRAPLLGHVPVQRTGPAPARGDGTALAGAELRVLTDGRAAVVVDTLMFSAVAHADMRPALVLGTGGRVEAWLGEQRLSGRNAHALWERIAASQDLPVDHVRAKVLAALTISAEQLTSA